MIRPLFGMVVLLAAAWCCGTDRRAIPWRTVFAGIGLQFALAILMVRVPGAAGVLALANHAALALQRATDVGARFVFGYLAGPPLPFHETHPGGAFILAFNILPLVLTISALSALLFHWGVLQAAARGFAWLLRRTLGVGGALALGAAVHVFVGMIEAPLLIRPYLARMQGGEIFALMACGLAGIAGTVMVLYATIIGPVIPDALGHILAAAVISTPASLAVAAIMVPFTPGDDRAEFGIEGEAASSFDALIRGVQAGIAPLVGIATVLLVAVALVALVNAGLAHLPDMEGAPVTLQRIFAVPFRPVMWLIGIPWAESGAAARLMATKTVLNEFIAYLGLAHLPPGTLSPHSVLIMTTALCGFANFGSLGILVGGLSAMVPERRAEIARFGPRAVLAGTIATCLSGAVVGMIG